MAAMTTALTEFSTLGDSRTYTQASHTASEPKLVIQKRRVPQGNQSVAESTVSVIDSTEDSNGEILSSKVMFSATARYPVEGLPADVATALATFRDIVAGDEFGNTVTTQEFLK